MGSTTGNRGRTTGSLTGGASCRREPGPRRASAFSVSALLAALIAIATVGVIAWPAVASAAAGESSPWELTSVHGPTNVVLRPSVNEVVTLRFHANVGKFLLEFSNEQTDEKGETKYVPFDATAKEVQEALEKLRSGEPKTAIGAGNVSVAGGYDAATETGTYTIEFTGALGGRDLGEEPIEMSSEATSHEEAKFEKEQEKLGTEREVEEPEGEAELTTPGYHDGVDYQLIPDDRGDEPITSSPAHRLTIVDKLPPGLTLVEMPRPEIQHGERDGEGWSCKEPSGGLSEKELERRQKEEEKRDQEDKLPQGAGLSEVECTLVNFLHPTTEPVVYPDGPALTLPLEAYVDNEALQGATSLEDKARIEGGEVKHGETGEAVAGTEAADTAPIASQDAPFGVQIFGASTTGPDGQTYTQAGGHPYAATTSVFFNTSPRTSPEGFTEPSVVSRAKDVDVKLPAGFYGNPLATLGKEGHAQRCPQSEFTEGVPGGPVPEGSCPPATQVGEVSVFLKEFSDEPETVALYNLQPPAGVPAEFGFIYSNLPIRLDAHVVHEAANGGEYRVSVASSDVNEAYDVYGVQVTLWGEPASPSHNAERFKDLFERGAEPGGPEAPFLTNPADCAVEAEALEPGASDGNLAPVTTALVDSWQQPGPLDSEGNPELPNPNWSEANATSPRVTGCESLKFEPKISFLPRPPAASEQEAEEKEAQGPTQSTPYDTPSGYTFQLQLPQHETPTEPATPQLRDTTVTLPEGVTLSPSSATGLEACTAKEIELSSTGPGECPLASQVGKVTIVSQLLEKPLEGRVYLGEPACSPCDGAQVEEGQLVKMYIELEGAGVRVKLAGSASVDQSNGRITTTFLNNPQLPFEKLTLKLKIGPRAPLVSAQVCTSSLLASATLTPWSVGATTPGGEAVGGTPTPSPFDAEGPFGITGCPASLPFEPGFSAGSESSAAGQYTNFDATFSRQDGEQTLSGVTVTTPPGLLGKIAGIPRCEGTAAESTTEPCPAESQIGTATSAAGAGPEPFVDPKGKVYLTGPYKDGPFGLKVEVPAEAGPFNLGVVVVRSAITINPRTGAITVTSDPLPQSIDGIPLRLKTVKVDINRPEFMFNPTNCETQAVSASLTGEPASSAEAAGSAQRSVPFTASSCGALTFAPTFTAASNAEWTKFDGTDFVVKVTQKPGEASIRKVELQLPEDLPSRNETLQKACTEQQFAQNPAGCPEASFVGTATAHTPVLAAPLTGPAILVSHGNEAFPDLVFLLQGENVHIELVGHTFIKKVTSDGVTREVTESKFEAVPDAPISSFETDLPAGRHSILTGYGNLCEEPMDAPTTIVAQNGLRVTQDTQIAVAGCGPQPKLTIVKSSVKGSKVLLTVKLSAAGTVAVSGGVIRDAQEDNGCGAAPAHAVAHQDRQGDGQASPQVDPAGDPDRRQTGDHQDHEGEAVSAPAGIARAGSPATCAIAALAAALVLAHAGAARAESCPNAGRRAEQGVAEGSAHVLPDCRAYELASPPLKNEQEVSVPDRFVAEASFQAAEEGGGVLYSLSGAIPGSESGGLFGHAVSTSPAPGSPWSAVSLEPSNRLGGLHSAGQNSGEILSASPTLGCGAIRTRLAAPAFPGEDEPQLPKGPLGELLEAPEEEIDNLYLWRSPDEYTLISNVRPESPNKTPEGPTYHVDGISEDCSTVLFEDENGGYELPVGPKGEPAPETSLYEWKVGASPETCRAKQETCRPQVASVLPDGTLATEVVDAHAGEVFSDLHQLSRDGRRAYFTAISDGDGPGEEKDAHSRQIYLRENGHTTAVSISPDAAVRDTGAKFEAASADGERVFFVANYGLTGGDGTSTCLLTSQNAEHDENDGAGTGCDLYEYDVGNGSLTNLSADTTDPRGADVRGLLGISEDGSVAYFASTGQLIPGEGNTAAEDEATTGTTRSGEPKTEAEANVYAYSGGALHYVATIGEAEAGGWNPGESPFLEVDAISAHKGMHYYNARVSSNGDFLLFATRHRTGAYDNAEQKVKTPNIEVITEQRLKGEASYTTAKLKGEVGETVEYRVAVKNTGSTTLGFEALKDPQCTNFSPSPAAFELAPGAEQTYTCEHVLAEGDGPLYKNIAVAESGGKEKQAKEVEVEVKEGDEFEIKDEQKIAGEAAFTTARLSGEVGKTVEYEITVTNTGSASMKFSAPTDGKCTGITPFGETEVEAGASESFACEHMLGEVDENPFENTATITGRGVKKTSNTVEVEFIKPEWEQYEYSLQSGAVSCASCNPSGEQPIIDPHDQFSALGPFDVVQNGIIKRNLTNDGRVFFDSFQPLQTTVDGAPSVATNRSVNVYEWVPAGLEGCVPQEVGAGLPQPSGCLAMLSSGTDPFPSYFEGASDDAQNAYITTHAALVPQDQDGLNDIYDVRVDGGIPAPPAAPSCSAEMQACQPAGAGIGSSTHASESSAGGGNVSGSTSTKPVTGVEGTQSVKASVKGAVKGTTATILVVAPAAGKILASGAGLTTVRMNAAKAATYKLKVSLTAKEKKLLRRKHKLKLKVRVSFTPATGRSSVTTASLTFL